jgi:hypothetical protein
MAYFAPPGGIDPGLKGSIEYSDAEVGGHPVEQCPGNAERCEAFVTVT